MMSEVHDNGGHMRIFCLHLSTIGEIGDLVAIFFEHSSPIMSIAQKEVNCDTLSETSLAFCFRLFSQWEQ